jgi:hypothetical protein
MRRLILFLIAVGLFVCRSVCQESVTISSDPNDLSRPISTLIDQIRKREKISITYEDPRYENSADIEDVTERVSRGTELEKKYGPRFLVPKGHAITFVYKPSGVHDGANAKTTISRMLQEYAAGGGPVFIVSAGGTRLHVVPSELLSSSGTRARQDSILESQITVPPAARDGGQLLEAICDEIRRQTGFKIGVGPSVPGNNLARYRTGKGIDQQPARAAIADLLDHASVAGAFDWDLYFDPTDKAYVLNFAYVGSAGPVDLK